MNNGCNQYFKKVHPKVRRFQLGEGPSRGLLRDYEPSVGPF